MIWETLTNRFAVYSTVLRMLSNIELILMASALLPVAFPAHCRSFLLHFVLRKIRA